jgi:hypothetical protein
MYRSESQSQRSPVGRSVELSNRSAVRSRLILRCATCMSNLAVAREVACRKITDDFIREAPAEAVVAASSLVEPGALYWKRVRHPSSLGATPTGSTSTGLRRVPRAATACRGTLRIHRTAVVLGTRGVPKRADRNGLSRLCAASDLAQKLIHSLADTSCIFRWARRIASQAVQYLDVHLDGVRHLLRHYQYLGLWNLRRHVGWGHHTREIIVRHCTAVARSRFGHLADLWHATGRIACTG